jgi:hypothetical protein
VCPLTRCIGTGIVSVVLFRRRSTFFQSTVTAKPESEFIHQARFAPGWNFGEPHPFCARIEFWRGTIINE